MNQFSPAELEELRLLAVSVMDTQFQFWISITFAVIVARFAAGDRLTKELRYIAALLYGLATFVLLARFIDEGSTANLYADLLRESDAQVPDRVGMPTLLARYSLFGLGTAAALFFLLKGQIGSRRR